jgi:hypothetical protein
MLSSTPSRFIRTHTGELLVTHQSFSHVGGTFLAPYKALAVDAEGTLRLTYWQANEGLKGSEVTASHDSAGFLTPPINLSMGAVIEARVSLSMGTDPMQWPGFALESRPPENSTLVVIDGAARCVTFNVSSASAVPVTTSPPTVLHTWDRELPWSPPGTEVTLRLLYRLSMLELYLNDVLLAVFLAPPGTGRVRLLTPRNSSRTVATSGHNSLHTRRWDMSITTALGNLSR